MILNYVLNCAVIGLPIVRGGHASFRAVAVDLVFFTIIAQLADRIGAAVGFVLAFVLAFVLQVLTAASFVQGESGLGLAIVVGVVLSFIASGSAIAALVVLFARRRWAVPRGRIWKIAIAAGILTNPLLSAPLFFVLRRL